MEFLRGTNYLAIIKPDLVVVLGFIIDIDGLLGFRFGRFRGSEPVAQLPGDLFWTP